MIRRADFRVSLCAVTAAILQAAGAPCVRADKLSDKADQFVAASIQASPRAGWSRVIVRFTGDLSDRQRALLKSLRVDIYRDLNIIHSAALAIPNKEVEKLAALPFVQHISADSEVRKLDEFTVGSSCAATAWQSPNNLDGSGVTVAVVDSGVHPLLDLAVPGLIGTGLLSKTRIIQSVNFVAGTSGVDDSCGHGTHVAGIVAGNGSSSTGLTCYHTYYGMAPKANLINVRVLDNLGMGTVSQVVAGVQWCVTNRAKYSIRVLNLSLGHPVGESYATDPLCQAVETAWKAGILVVCAAGNDGRYLDFNASGMDNEGWGTAYGSIQSPANDPYVLTVGAMKSMDGTRANDRIATYSSRGPSRLDLVLKPDIVAPGNKVISTLADGSYLQNAYSGSNQIPWSAYSLSLLGGNSNKYFRLSGTSMASPVVAGAAALMLQAQPTLSPDTIKARLMISADKWVQPDGTTDPCTFGAGYVNVGAALKNAVVATQAAMSPVLQEDSAGNIYISMDGTLWGTRAIWGTGINDLRAVWGTRAIWGTSANILNASRAIWGTNVWGDRAIWGTATSAVDLSNTAIRGD